MNSWVREQAAVTAYLQEYPYRENYLNSELGARLLSHIAEHRQQNSRGYWYPFGYEIAGPLCYAFVKWLSDVLDQQYPGVTDIAFIARDGYLLQKIYKTLPSRTARKTHYIYAPRAMSLNCKTEDACNQYKNYLKTEAFGKGTIAIVDTVTMRFSAQKLIEASVEQPIIGLYWAVLREAIPNGKGLKFQTFQKEQYHVIRSWNIMEFIMTSPEPPVQTLKNGKPVYYSKNEFEDQRVAIFSEMSEGILEFVSDLYLHSDLLPIYSEKFAVGWLNDFLLHPRQEDVDAFEPVKFSMLPDHSDSIPLAPFLAGNEFSPPSLIDRVWFFAQQHQRLYALLHKGKGLYKKILHGN